MLEGKKGLVLGAANKRSIATAIAKTAARSGAQVALSYANDRLKGYVEELGQELSSPLVLPCDVSSDEQIEAMFKTIGEEWGELDFLVHAVAFAKKEELGGGFHETSREGYHLAQDISAYSLTAVTRAALPLMEGRSSSVLTLTYLGSERVIPNYNVMGVAKAALEASVRYLAESIGQHGVRVNAISAGPIKTLSAAGVSKFSSLLATVPERAPLRRNVTAEDVGDASMFFLSDMSRAVTGEIMYVDCGYHILGI